MQACPCLLEERFSVASVLSCSLSHFSLSLPLHSTPLSPLANEDNCLLGISLLFCFLFLFLTSHTLPPCLELTPAPTSWYCFDLFFSLSPFLTLHTRYKRTNIPHSGLLPLWKYPPRDYSPCLFFFLFCLTISLFKHTHTHTHARQTLTRVCIFIFYPDLQQDSTNKRKKKASQESRQLPISTRVYPFLFLPLKGGERKTSSKVGEEEEEG